MDKPKPLSASNRLRNHTANDFVEAYNNAENNEERGEVRSKLKRIDSGRWYSLLDEAHSHLSHTDLAARDHISDLYSHNFLVWVGVFGLVEDLNTFEDVTGVERSR